MWFSKMDEFTHQESKVTPDNIMAYGRIQYVSQRKILLIFSNTELIVPK